MSKVNPTYCFVLRFQPDKEKEAYVHYVVEIDSQKKTLDLNSSVKPEEYLLSNLPIETWKDSAASICNAIEAECPGFSVSQDVNMIAKLISVTFEANEPVVFFEKVE